jgi:hypothetical protein
MISDVIKKYQRSCQNITNFDFFLEWVGFVERKEKNKKIKKMEN